MRPSGQSTVVTVAVVGGVVAVVYWLVFFGFKYLDNFPVKEAAEIAIGQAYDFSDENLRSAIMQRANAANNGWHREVDESGQFIEVPGLGLTEENITIERDDPAKFIRITVRYDRDVRYFPTNKWTTMHFEVVREGTHK